MEEKLKEEMGGMAMGNGGIAGAGVNQDGSPFNASVTPSGFGEPGKMPGSGGNNLLRRKRLLPNAPAAPELKLNDPTRSNLLTTNPVQKPLRTILNSTGRV